MKQDKLIKEASRLAEPFCITKGEKFRLKDWDPAATTGVKNKQQAQNIIDAREGVLNQLQEKLYAQDRWALLVVLQALDAAGKDGVIKHVMSGVNPQGCDVHAFKSPSNEELNHDYLWRTQKCIPERGKIGIFNRSYYEEVLVVRVHPTLLKAERLPDGLATKHIWDQRYEEMIQNTATKLAPWFIVPADNKWFTRLIVASAIIQALDDLHLSFPVVDEAKKKELEAVRRSLLAQKD